MVLRRNKNRNSDFTAFYENDLGCFGAERRSSQISGAGRGSSFRFILISTIIRALAVTDWTLELGFFVVNTLGIKIGQRSTVEK